MKITMNARKATRNRRGRVRAKALNHKQHYFKFGRQHYVRNRSAILKKARIRYARNKARYARSRAKWMRKTGNGKRPLYLHGTGKGRRPVYPRLKPLHRKVRPGSITGKIPSKTGTAFRKTAKKLWRSKARK